MKSTERSALIHIAERVVEFYSDGTFAKVPLSVPLWLVWSTAADMRGVRLQQGLDSYRLTTMADLSEHAMVWAGRRNNCPDHDFDLLARIVQRANDDTCPDEDHPHRHYPGVCALYVERDLENRVREWWDRADFASMSHSTV